MYFKFFILIFFFLPEIVGASLVCPSDTNLVQLKSPFSNEEKLWCQLNVKGKFLKHGLSLVYKDGKLLKKEFYNAGVRQLVGSFEQVAGEGRFYHDYHFACSLSSNAKDAVCKIVQPLLNPHHVFYDANKKYQIKFPEEVENLFGHYLSICGVSKLSGNLLCFDPSFSRIKERLKHEKLYEENGYYKFKETWDDGNEYQRVLSKEFLQNVILHPKDKSFYIQTLKANSEQTFIHQNYACIINKQTELDCFSRPSYGAAGVTFYNEKPFDGTVFVGGSFSHMCIEKDKFIHCYYFRPQEHTNKEAYILEKLKFIGPLARELKKVVVRDHIFWLEHDGTMGVERLKPRSGVVHKDLRGVVEYAPKVNDAKDFAIQGGSLCFLKESGQLYCYLQERAASRVKMRSLKQYFPKKKFQSIHQSRFPEQVGQFCLKELNSIDHFCFQALFEKDFKGKKVSF